MIGRLVFDDGDRCKECPIADLRVETLYSDNRVALHIVMCSHEAACSRTEYITKFNGENQHD